MLKPVLCVCLLVSCAAATARAQSPLPADPAENSARVHTGLLTLNPRFELLDTGVDSNVFNDSQNPQHDFTATFRPSLDAVLRLNIFRLVYKVAVDAVYFQKFKDERSLNRTGDMRTELRFSRLVPYFTVTGLSTGNRPNNEIDLRAQRTFNTYGGGAAFLLFSRTAAVVNYQRQRLEYDPGQTYAGEDLATQFNNLREAYDVGARIALTELTTMSVTGGQERMRFTLSPERDSDSTRAGVSFDFNPAAIITGTAAFGYRDFKPASPSLAPYRGLVAQATVKYAYQDRTAVSVRYLRDVDYSVEEAQPYYLLNAGTLTVTQRIGGPFDLQGVIGREVRSYRSVAGAVVTAASDSDTTDTATAGFGYRLGETTRLSINVEFTKRDALDTGRSYDRRRIYCSVSYGF